MTLRETFHCLVRFYLGWQGLSPSRLDSRNVSISELACFCALLAMQGSNLSCQEFDATVETSDNDVLLVRHRSQPHENGA